MWRSGASEAIGRFLPPSCKNLPRACRPPTELKQSVYEYSFTPVNLKDINAFALPGGPMFVQRGMFDAAAEEAEVTGVMAHELSRVLLRHPNRLRGGSKLTSLRQSTQ